MAMIYRRTPHGGGARLTTTIPLSGDAPTAARSHSLDADDNDKDADGLAPCAASRWPRLCRAWRRGTVASPLPTRALTAPADGLSYRLCQIMWQALLVYAFFGLPVLGRILNFCRYFHRFSAPSIVTGLLVGFFQDFAIFVQASTVIVLIKALFQPVAIHRRLSAMAAAAASSAATSGSATTSITLGGTGATGLSASAAMAQERYPHSYGAGPRHVHLPVYFPVRMNEYEMHGASASTGSSGEGASENDPLDATHASPPKHLTLVASSSSTMTSFPWSLSSSTTPMSPAAVALSKARNFCANVLVVVLVKVVLILATVASVADFCLQVTMHPRLNRAFVEIFFNYMHQFTGSLMDEEVLTPPVVFVWATYIMLVSSMTYGFYTERLPFLPDLLMCSSGASGSSGTASSWCCVRRIKQLSSSCTGIVKRRSYRKDSSLPLPAASSDESTDQDGTTTSSRFMKALYRSYWRRKESDIIILNDASSGLTSSVSAANRSHRRRRSSSQGHGSTMLGLHSTGVFGGSSFSGGSSGTWMKPKSPFGIVLHCIVASVLVTLAALCASLIVHTSAGALSRTASKHHALIGVDMQLMANPMFSLQTENFFTRKSRIGADHINCTSASATLRATLAKGEVYDTTGLGNDDSCALLWRKTMAYEGETWWDVNWNVSRELPVDETPTALPSKSPGETEQPKKTTVVPPRQPNIIVLNMESWRYLDVGVLGAAEKKRKYGKSVTPNFDRLSKEGVLYRKHYTQCVQTTRTLLTTLFGMLPSCTETTALKMYGTGLTVQGLPQFLKSRGYFNMFWSAVDLTWEYWDKFLLQNGFDKLVDDQKVRKMLHDTRNYKDREDDHFSWGMHDHLSFDMLLYALEFAKNTTSMPASVLEDLAVNATIGKNATGSAAVETNKGALVNGTDQNTAKEVSMEKTRTETDATKATSSMRGRKDRGEEGKPKKQHAAKSSPETLAAASVGPAGVSRRIKPTIGWEGLREPYFIDMYTITSHNPWALPLDYEVPDLTELYTRFNKRYIDSMYFSDEMLGKFIDSMRAKGLMNNTIVIIEGDHGYGRLEHDNNPSIADSAVYDEATHVPFLILADDFLTADQRGLEVDQLTMQSDLMATIADMLGVTEQEPLLQHGVGHSMRRKRGPRPTVRDVDFDVIHKSPQDDQEKERRVVLCNPFNGLTKGVRTEELKYVYNPDGSFKVFELERDPVEKKPIASGYDYEQMDDAARDMLDFVSEQVDLNQFLFETNKFTTPIPAVTAAATKVSRSRVTEETTQEVSLEKKPERESDVSDRHTHKEAIATAEPTVSIAQEATDTSSRAESQLLAPDVTQEPVPTTTP